jgi:methylenetetrahydrofolate reductase (NADPH)
MINEPQRQVATGNGALIVPVIARMAREATIELNHHELKDLESSRRFLAAGKRVYVSFLPKQSWAQTEDACRAIKAAGFDPVPHVPVRLLKSAQELSGILRGLVRQAQISEVLLIAGDYAEASGPFHCVADVLRSSALTEHGLHRVSLAGHPEGHPKVALDEIRRAELEKVELADRAGLDASLVTQMFFDALPFVDWARELRGSDVRCRIVGGVAGPARITTLFKFALRCGVGPSIRALGARPSSLVKIIGDHGPQAVMRSLAESLVADATDIAGLHFFCFGGYLRTCEWLQQVAESRFTLDDNRGFDLM